MATALQERPKKREKIAIQDWDLNPRQMQFAELYASDKEFFGNGVESYIEAYEPNQSKPNWYKSACSSASRLLSSVKVYQYINHLLEMRGLNDSFIDKQLEFLVTQHADFKSKLGAIHEYNQLRRRTEGGGNKTLVVIIAGESANRYAVQASQEPR
jgi:hypothetical protein